MICLQIFATNLKNSAIIFFENRFKNLNILVSSSLANFLRISRQRSIELDEHAFGELLAPRERENGLYLSRPEGEKAHPKGNQVNNSQFL